MTAHETIAPAPVVKSVRVSAPPDRAFAAFVAMGRWWPRTHSISKGAALADAILEPRAGGRWFERGEDGAECDWGRVLAYEPPSRLLLAWQIDGAWTFRPELVTEVEVLFEPDGTGTRVRLEHRNLERFGPAAEAVRAAFESDNGWTGLLTLYAANI